MGLDISTPSVDWGTALFPNYDFQSQMFGGPGVSDIFGSFGDWLSGGDQQTTSETVPWSELQPYLIQGYEGLGSTFFPGGELSPQQYFPEQTVAGFTPEQMAGQESLMSHAQNLPGMISGYGDVLNRMTSGQPDMNVWGPLMNQMSQSAAQNFTEEVMPAIRSEAVNAGQFGGPRQTLGLGKAAGRIAEGLSRGQAQLAGTAGLASLQQQRAGASMMPEYFGLGTMPGDIMGQVGGQNQLMNQAMIDADVNRWNFQQQAPANALAQYMSILQGGPAYSSTTTNQEVDRLMQLLGLGAAGVGAYYGAQ